MKLSLRRQARALIPADTASTKLIEQMPFDQTFFAEVRKPRNGKAHRLYWAMCQHISEALNDAPGGTTWTQEMVSDRLKLATGRADVIPLPRSLADHYGAAMGGTLVGLKPQSIAFHKMDDSEFSAFLQDCLRYVENEFGVLIDDHPAFAEVRLIVRGVAV